MKFTTLQWNDPFLLESQLSSQEIEVRDRARHYAQSKLMPRVTEAFRTENFDPYILREMGELGFLGADLKGYGCQGLSYVSYGLIANEIEKVDSGFRTVFSVQSSLAMHAIYLHGSEGQKQRFLPEMAKGKLIGCFAITEPLHGSDPSSMETTALKVDGGYILNGHKKWIGLAAIADVMIIWAKNEEDVVQGFIIEKGTKGLQTSYIQGKLSLRCAPTCEIQLSNVFVPEDNRLQNAQGLSAPFACMNMARFAIAWGALGAAESCWNIAREYALQKNQFNHPLAASQLVQKKLVDMQTEIAIGLQACLRVGRLLESDKAAYEMLSMIKRNATIKAQEVARNAREILGANGILDDYHVMRHMMNLETVATYEGASDIHALILGRSQTGLSAF